MINKLPKKSIRATTALAVAAICLASTVTASAQTLSTNIFGGTNTGADSISVGGGITAGAQNTGPLGPGFTGNVNLGIGAGTTLSETLNPTVGGVPTGALTIAETGAVGVVGGFGATKTFTNDPAFIANQFYRFTLVRTTASAVSLLSNLSIQLTTTTGGVTTTVLDTSTGGTSLNLSLLLSTSNTATFVFQAPANVSTTSPITFTISGGVTAGALNNTFTFSNASLVAVPEPQTWGMVGAGCAGLLLVCGRRRSA